MVGFNLPKIASRSRRVSFAGASSARGGRGVRRDAPPAVVKIESKRTLILDDLPGAQAQPSAPTSDPESERCTSPADDNGRGSDCAPSVVSCATDSTSVSSVHSDSLTSFAHNLSLRRFDSREDLSWDGERHIIVAKCSTASSMSEGEAVTAPMVPPSVRPPVIAEERRRPPIKMQAQPASNSAKAKRRGGQSSPPAAAGMPSRTSKSMRSSPRVTKDYRRHAAQSPTWPVTNLAKTKSRGGAAAREAPAKTNGSDLNSRSRSSPRIVVSGTQETPAPKRSRSKTLMDRFSPVIEIGGEFNDLENTAKTREILERMDPVGRGGGACGSPACMERDDRRAGEEDEEDVTLFDDEGNPFTFEEVSLAMGSGRSVPSDASTGPRGEMKEAHRRCHSDAFVDRLNALYRSGAGDGDACEATEAPAGERSERPRPRAGGDEFDETAREPEPMVAATTVTAAADMAAQRTERHDGGVQGLVRPIRLRRARRSVGALRHLARAARGRL